MVGIHAPRGLRRGSAFPNLRAVSSHATAPALPRVRTPWTALALLALLFGLARFVRLSSWSLWHDEALALSDALHGQGMANPLGYLFYRVAFAGAEVRPDELMLRLPAAVCGLLTIPLILVLFRGLLPRRQVAAAALLVAVSHWHVYWSQNARFYTLALDLGLIGGALALSGVMRGSTARVLAGLAVLIAAVTTHPSAAFLLCGVLAGPWIARWVGLVPADGARGPWRALLAATVLLVLAGAPWASEVWETWVSKKSASPAHFVASTGFYVGPFLGVGAICGAVLLLRRRDLFGSLVLATLVAALGAAVVAAMFARMSAQYVFCLLPWIALVAAAPLGAESRRGFTEVPRWVGRGYLALLVLPALTQLVLYFTVAHGDRPRWREAYEYVQERSLPGDLILGMEAPVGEYYLASDPAHTEVRHWREVAYLDRFRARLAAQWSRYPRRTWVVMNHEQLADWGAGERDLFLATLRQEFRWEETFSVRVAGRDLDVLVYLRE